MLKITRNDRATGPNRLQLEGRLTRQEIPALEAAFESCRERAREVVLDLAGLRFADAEGAATLRRLRKTGVVLEGSTPFLSELIHEEGA